MPRADRTPTRPRWRKLLADAGNERGRLAAMIVAVAVSLAALGTILGGWAVLTREIAVNYLGTAPAEASLELPGGADPALVQRVRELAAVAEADAREVVLARVRVADDWRPLLLFVADDFTDLRLNTFRPIAGAWPPPTGTLLLERSAVSMAEADIGDSLLLQLPRGEPQSVPIRGLVHDPGLAPAWQERSVYAYATRATLAALAGDPTLHELRVVFRPAPADIAAVERAAESLGRWLIAEGHPVHEIRVPPPRQHPHQRQMVTILILMLSFAALALVLSSVLVANSLAAMLARQIREIGVMKTLGARSAQLAAMYLALVGAIGLASVAVALPLGAIGARAMSTAIAAMLNFDRTDPGVPAWVFAAQALAGLAVPLAIAAIPIARAARISVRAALDSHGVAPASLRPWVARLPAAARSLLRRRARSALTIGLLATAGAMFMMSLAVARAWERNLDKIHESRHYDVEVRFGAAEPTTSVAWTREVAGVREVEAWGYSPAAIARPGQLDVVRTYPDRGHGSFAVLAPPADTTMIDFPLLAGRWLRADDTDAVVLNHVGVAQSGARVGDTLLLSIDGVPSPWTVVGVVEEIGAAGVAYVESGAFARVTGTSGARVLRVATTATGAGERERILRAIDRTLRARVDLEVVLPFSELRTAVGDHVIILVRMLVAMAVILATVGLLGLASAMGTSVVERTREIGVMKAIGATGRRIRRLILGEALVIVGVSWVVAVLVSLPLTWLVEDLVGRLGFLAPLPFVVAPAAMLGWLALVTLGGTLATLLPARRAARLTVRAALAET